MAKQSCATCAYFSDVVSAGDGYGACRRYPPKRLPLEQYSYFPQISESDWCGEWKGAEITEEPVNG